MPAYFNKYELGCQNFIDKPRLRPEYFYRGNCLDCLNGSYVHITNPKISLDKFLTLPLYSALFGCYSVINKNIMKITSAIDPANTEDLRTYKNKCHTQQLGRKSMHHFFWQLFWTHLCTAWLLNFHYLMVKACTQTKKLLNRVHAASEGCFWSTFLHGACMMHVKIFLYHFIELRIL